MDSSFWDDIGIESVAEIDGIDVVTGDRKLVLPVLKVIVAARLEKPVLSMWNGRHTILSRCT